MCFTRDNSFLLISPFQSLPEKQENPFPSTSRHTNISLSVYFSLNSELQLSKSKEFNNKGMKVQVKSF